jgi:hypothetical protein
LLGLKAGWLFGHMYGLKSLRENWKTVRFVVEAPAFMRGKERFSAPGKSRDVDHAL